MATVASYDYLGAQKQYKDLRDLMDRKSFVKIVTGPAGSGKSTLIRKAAEDARLRVETFSIEHQSLPKLEEGIRKLGGTTLDNTANADVVWHVLGADLLGPKAWQNKNTWYICLYTKICYFS